MLLRLEVDNFKSYHGQQILGPFKTFTAVIGPNGAGKSNLMDAVSFVFGVRAQHLRSSVLKNLIYGAGTSRAAKKASVRAVFQASDQDKEIHFIRSIKPDGSCEYRIDDEAVTQEKYLDRLAQINILSKAKNFLVFQGDVEKLAQKSPRELSQFLEQISGSADIKGEYEECLLAKEKTEDEVRDNLQKRRGIKSEKRQYMDQKEEADKFQKLTSQKDKITLDHYLFQFCQLKKQVERREREKSEAKEELGKEQVALELAQRHVKEKRREQAKDHKKFLLLDEKIKKKGTEIKRLYPDRINIDEQIDHAQKKLDTDKKQLERVEQQHAKHEKNLAKLKKELNDVNRRQKVWEEAASQDVGTDVQLQKSQLIEYNKLKEQAALEAMDIQQEIEKCDREVAESRNAREREKVKVTELQKALEQQLSKKVSWEERRKTLEIKMKETKRLLNDYKKQRAEISQSDNTETQQVEYLSQELEKMNNQLREAKADRQESERDRRFNETLERLRQLFPGCIKGRVIDLCTPINRKYNTAIPIAMGRNLDAIVVDTNDTAKSCLSYLKEQKAGVATFIPLQGIQTKPTNERLRQLGGTKKLIIDVIQYDKAVSKAMEYACGNTIVCDTLEEARQLCFNKGERYKCVTVDGTLIQKSGNMTGGQSGVESHAQRWEEKAVNELKRQRDHLQKEFQDINRKRFPRQQELAALETQIARLERDQDNERTDIMSTDERLDMVDKEVATLQSGLASLDLKGLEKELNKRIKHQERIHRSKDEINDRVFEKFCTSIGIANIREYEGKELQSAKERQRLQVEFHNIATRIAAQISYESSRDHLTEIKKWTKAVTEGMDRVQSVTKMKEELAEKIAAMNSEISILQEQQKEVKALVDDWETALKELRREETSRSKKVVASEKRLNTLEGELDQFKGNIHSLLRACRVDEIPIPFIEGGLEDLELELGSQAGGDLESLETQDRSMLLEREAAVKIDFSSLSDELQKEMSREDCEPIEQQYMDKLRTLQTKIDVMAPNMRAMERLESVRARLKATEDEFEAVRAKAQLADKRFREIQRKRFELFDACYQHVSLAIDKIYKDLTKNPDPSSILPGGTAYLTLENQEEPYLYGVEYNTMPPAKRFRSMEQLSGGEKTVAALALLFAIHSFRPAPFFVLDEIDAALDAVNVAKVANFIKEKFNECQCVVISLKDSFYSKADGIVGVYRDQGEESSHLLTLDLGQFNA